MSMQSWVERAYGILHPAYKANRNHGIPEHWLAGLVYVECARLDPRANRFEPHVYKSVETVKNMGKSSAFPGFNSGPIHDFIKSTSDPAKLRSLATSYGLGQLMGYHYVNKWRLAPEIYTNLAVQESVRFTLDFMADGMRYAKTFEELLRWHNTGSINGKTYHPDYVKNAEGAAAAYKAYMEKMGQAEQPKPELPQNQQTKVLLADIESDLEAILQKVRTAKAQL